MPRAFSVVRSALRPSLGLLLVLLAGAPSACSSSVPAGLAAYERGNYRKALAAWEPLAERGDPAAQFLLSILYAEGQGVACNDERALALLTASAERGFAPAQNNLGLCYFEGHGVDRNAELAERWFRLAAEQGYGQAQHNLAVLQLLACSAPQRGGETEDLLVDSALRGETTSMYLLGSIDRGPDASGLDHAIAMQWLHLAALEGDVDAQTRLGMRHLTGDGVHRDEAEAGRWLGLAAEQGSTVAQTNLAILHLRGAGVRRDDAEALRLLRLAAAQGCASAQARLGAAYESGRGVDRDSVMALAWYSAAADGDALARERRDALAATMTAEDVALAAVRARDLGITGGGASTGVAAAEDSNDS